MSELLQVAHVAVFALVTGSCLAALVWVRQLASTEIRYGLYGLFVASALWAAGQLVLFLNPPLALARASYYTALIAGLTTVSAWLYFCSAYAGHEYHRTPRYRRGVLAVFLSVVALKLTNPVHRQYFDIQRVETPFPHANPQLFELHAAVEVLAYSAVAIGFYMLFELFRNSDIPTRGLAALASLTVAPVLLNLLGELGVSALVANSYEPIGVAMFALGTLVLADEQFEEVRWSAETQLLDQINEGVLIVDESGLVRDFNESAQELFPAVRSGCPLNEIDSSLATDGGAQADTEGDSRILAINRDGETLYYLLNRTPLAIGPDMAASALVVSNVTKVETQRRELKRQSEQLEGFSEAVAHELRNTLTIASSNVTLLSDALADGEGDDAEQMLDRIRGANNRMIDIVDDLSTLARLSQVTTEMESVWLAHILDDARKTVASTPLTASVETERQIRADRTRTRELLQNAMELGAEVEAEQLEISVADGSITLTYTVTGMPAFDNDGFLKYGEAVPHAEAGMYGPNIRALARAQEWTVTVEQQDSGFSLVLSGIESVES
ncbi:histidine kinase N-terminal 7TM domain-containing protein [Halovenus halobia]|uniref:histidine kinase N-terminal 7TM domain-containing protein n=1 Tax=Halovenus halobia TaxID=3396622 RepID=UPI003F579B86